AADRGADRQRAPSTQCDPGEGDALLTVGIKKSERRIGSSPAVLVVISAKADIQGRNGSRPSPGRRWGCLHYLRTPALTNLSGKCETPAGGRPGFRAPSRKTEACLHHQG